MNLALIVFTAFVFGSVAKGHLTPTDIKMAPSISTSHVALVLTIAITCLDVFGSDRPVFWRESASGISVAAFFLARIALSLLDVWTLCLVYSISWYIAAQPPNSFWLYHQTFRSAAINAAGISYLVSTLMPPQIATLGVSITVLVMGAALAEPGAIAEAVGKGWVPEHIPMVAVFTWSAGWNFLEAVDRSGGKKVVNFAAEQFYDGYMNVLGPDYKYDAWIALHIMCFLYLIAAFLGLKYRNRDKQI